MHLQIDRWLIGNLDKDEEYGVCKNSTVIYYI